MQCEKNGVIVYHPYERPDPGPIQEKVGDLTIINIDRMMDIDTTKIDFIVHGDKYKYPDCGYEVIVGFGDPMVDGAWPQEVLKKAVSQSKDVVEILRR